MYHQVGLMAPAFYSMAGSHCFGAPLDLIIDIRAIQHRPGGAVDSKSSVSIYLNGGRVVGYMNVNYTSWLE